jgi:ATP phosphoribosyltransferase regulatory subunit
LLFSGGILADSEILLLFADCLDALGVMDWQLILGEAQLTRSLLAPFPEPLRQQVRDHLARLDFVGLQALNYADTSLKARALLLFDLRGNPKQVLEKVRSLEVDEVGEKAIENLESLINLIQSGSSQALPLILDLSLVQAFNYYTGIVFKAVSQSQQQLHILGQGGRYDRLLGLYHPQHSPAPGIGFSFNIEHLHSRLLKSEILPQTLPPTDWLIVPQSPQSKTAALHYAQRLRNVPEAVRIELDLGGRSPAQLRDYALNCHIKNIAWVQADGDVKIESL